MGGRGLAGLSVGGIVLLFIALRIAFALMPDLFTDMGTVYNNAAVTAYFSAAQTGLTVAALVITIGFAVVILKKLGVISGRG